GGIQPSNVTRADPFNQGKRRANRNHFKSAASVGVRGVQLVDLGRSEGNGPVSVEHWTGRGFAVGSESTRSIDRENSSGNWSGAVVGEAVDVGNGLSDRSSWGTSKPRTKEGIDDQRRGRERRP